MFAPPQLPHSFKASKNIRGKTRRGNVREIALVILAASYFSNFMAKLPDIWINMKENLPRKGRK